MNSKPDVQLHPPCSTRTPWLLATLLCSTLLLYLLHTLSPLRLNNDSYRLLSMALSAHETGAYLVDGYKDQYPNGYPWMIKTLVDLGLGSRPFINLLSFFWTSIGLLGWGLLIRRLPDFSLSKTLLALLLILCSWISIKHLILPMSDGAFFGASSFSLFFAYLFWITQSRRALLWALLALLLALAGVFLRTVGLSLVLTLGLLFVLHPYTRRFIQHFWRTQRHYSFLLLLALLCLGALVTTKIISSSWLHTQTIQPGSYLQSQLAILKQEGVLNTLVNIVRFRTTECAELILNVPSARLPVPGILLCGLGLLSAGALFSFAWQKRQALFPLLIYLLAQGLILASWPYQDSRFLLPLLPLFVILLISGLSPLWNSVLYRRIILLAMALFIGSGLVINLLSLRVSLSGNDFPRLYSAALAPAYSRAFGVADNANLAESYPGIVRILQRFEPLAQPQEDKH